MPALGYTDVMAQFPLLASGMLLSDTSIPFCPLGPSSRCVNDEFSAKLSLTGCWLEKWSVQYGGVSKIIVHKRLTEDGYKFWPRLDYTVASSLSYSVRRCFRKKKKSRSKERNICSCALPPHSLGSFLPPVSFRLCHVNCKDCFSLNNKPSFFIPFTQKNLSGVVHCF